MPKRRIRVGDWTHEWDEDFNWGPAVGAGLVFAALAVLVLFLFVIATPL